MDVNDVIRIAIGTNSCLYIDSNYQCWELVSEYNKHTVPTPGKPLHEYCLHGFGKLTGEEIKEIIPDAIAELTGGLTSSELQKFIEQTTQNLTETQKRLESLETVSEHTNGQIAGLELQIIELDPTDRIKH